MSQRLVLAVLVAICQVTTSCSHSPTATPSALNAQPEAENRAPTGATEPTPWTTWSEKGTIGGLLVLKHIRENLLANNLHDPHINYSGYSPVDCSKVNTNFRTADGTCNDRENPHVGAAGVAFGRNVDPKFIDLDAASKLMSPNPALVSKEFFTRDEFKPVPFLNMLAAVWIQFMNHDWLTHGRNADDNPYHVTMPSGPDRVVERTKDNPAGQGQYKNEFGKVTANDVTHWWDGSQIYGSSQAQQNAVRSFANGKIKTIQYNGKELLPYDSNLDTKENKQNHGSEITGFRDNWWLGLSMLHTLFVKEHNSIADVILKNNVTRNTQSGRWIWTNGSDVREMDDKQIDEQVFQTARLITTAVLAKIHTVEWTPAILPNPTLKRAMFTNWYGGANPNTWSHFLKKLPGFNKTAWSENVTCDYVICGIVGNHTDNGGFPFNITEEFTSVYRLHSLLPEILEIRNQQSKAKVLDLPFPDSRNEKSYPLMAKYEQKDLFYSFGVQHPGQLVLNNYPKFMQELTIPGRGTMDLGMVDILRDRERGVPRYNRFREGIGLKPITSYRDFFPAGVALDARQTKILEKFKSVYGVDSNGRDNVDQIDLLVGTLAEEVRPKSFGFGETQFQIFILMASRRLMTDRFFTKDFRKEIYTTSGINWVDHEGTLAQVIVRHMPELAPQVKGLETAFSPWNK